MAQHFDHCAEADAPIWGVGTSFASIAASKAILGRRNQEIALKMPLTRRATGPLPAGNRLHHFLHDKWIADYKPDYFWLVKHVPDAGSYAPVLVLVDQRVDGMHLSYDKMESFLAPYGNANATAVARDLDSKVENLHRESAA